jgi:hypothetical protein
MIGIVSFQVPNLACLLYAHPNYPIDLFAEVKARQIYAFQVFARSAESRLSIGITISYSIKMARDALTLTPDGRL